MNANALLPTRTHHGLKILAVSDFVDKTLTRKVETKSLEPVDLIVSCGDLDPEYLSFLRARVAGQGVTRDVCSSNWGYPARVLIRAWP